MELTPLMLVPLSDRAKALFIQWGMLEGATGIMPPDDPFDIVASLPNDWLLGSLEPQEGAHIVCEITLPSSIPVLH